MLVWQSFVDSVWLVIGTLSLTLLSGSGVEARTSCPNSFPFYACPRPGDLTKDTVCCLRNSRYTCCTPEYIQGWGIGLIVVGCIVFGSLIVLSICLCCRKRKRQGYMVFQDDLPPQQAGVMVFSAPPPRAAPGQQQYGYNTMAYPPSNVSLPPPYDHDPRGNQTPAPAQAQQTQQSQQDNNDLIREDAV